jgi:hypothetical protein
LKGAAWEDYKRRTKHWAIRPEYELLHAEAFRDLRYAPALKLLFWGFEKREVRKTNKRGRKRFQVIDSPFSFTYEEGRRRGLTAKQFGRAVRELIAHGFWDLEKQGSGLQGDYSLYRLSTRWKVYGQKNFERRDLPKRVRLGCFGFPKKPQKQREKSAGEQRQIAAVENTCQGEKSTVEN